MTDNRLFAACFAACLALVTPPAHAQASPPATARAPEWPEGAVRTVRVRAGERLHLELRALDLGGAPIEYRATGVPGSAAFTPHPGPDGSATLEWLPDLDDVGVHEIQITARAGGRDASQTLRAVVEEDWAGYLMPGAAFSSFVPNASDKWGVFLGGAVQFLIVGWIHRNDQPGPSHGRLHLDLDVLKSTRSEVSTALHVSGGVDLTFERNPSRRWLLPFSGLDVGVMFDRQQLTTLAHVTPMTGLHLWAGPNLFVTVSGGYLMPLNGQAFDELRGVRAKAGLNLSFW